MAIQTNPQGQKYDDRWQKPDGSYINEDNNLQSGSDGDGNDVFAANSSRVAELQAHRDLDQSIMPGSPQQPRLTYIPNTNYFINDSAFYGSNKNYEANANAQAAQAQNRQALQMTAAQLAPAVRETAPQIAANERSASVNIGQTQNANAAQLNQNQMMDTAQINRQDEWGRQGQQQLIGALQNQALGAAPSVAGGQLQAAQDRAAKQGMSMLASTRGGQSSSLAQRNMMNSLGEANQNSAHDAAQMKIQEQLNAQNQLGQQLGNMRSQDIGVNQAQAGLYQDSYGRNLGANMQNVQNQQQANMYNAQAYNQRQTDQANLTQQNQQYNAGQSNSYNLNQANLNQQSGLANQSAFNQFSLQQGQFDQAANTNNLQSGVTNRGMNDSSQQYWANLAVNQNRNDVSNAMQDETLKANQGAGQATITQRAAEVSQAHDDKNLAMGLQGVGTALSVAAMAASDERVKTNISSGESDMRALLDNITAHKYNYKEPESFGQSQGTFISPMAQEFEKSRLGKAMVEEKDGKKMLNYGHNLGTLWGAIATLNKDIKSLKNGK